MTFATDAVKRTLIEAGLQHVVQIRATEEGSDMFGREIPEEWIDTCWNSISEAQDHFPSQTFRNVVISDNDNELPTLQAAKDIYNKVEQELETVESAGDCGCGWGRACKF